MKANAQQLNNLGSKRRANPAPAEPVCPLGEAELDRVAAAGGSKNGGLASGGGISTQNFIAQPN